jgi:hypothetical protein
MSVAEYHAEIGHTSESAEAPTPTVDKPKPKFGNKKTWACPDCGGQAAVLQNDKMVAACCGVNAVEFDSKFEADRWAVLKVEEKMGNVRKLRRQVKIVIIFHGEPVKYKPSNRIMAYIADFIYESFDGELWNGIIEDTKGFDTKDSKIKRALVSHMTGIEVYTNFKTTKRKAK